MRMMANAQTIMAQIPDPRSVFTVGVNMSVGEMLKLKPIASSAV